MLRHDIERRMYKRVNVEVGLRYLVPLRSFDKVYTASTFDIGSGGIGLEVDDPMPDGTALVLELSPDKCGVEQDAIRLQAQCIWCEPKGDRYKVGIMFYYFDDELRDRVAKFVGALEDYAPLTS